MPNLRDYFASDLSTFINTDEFATKVMIDDDEISVVIDEDALKEFKLKNGGEGLANCEILFHVAKSDMTFDPKRGQDIMFDGELLYIANVIEDNGVYTIALEVRES
jgi:hypothetical protein